LAFEVFTKRLVPLAGAPYVTIQKRGTISINKAAHHLLGAPKAVELLYDSDTSIVGFRAVEPSVEHAYALRAMGGASRADGAGTTYLIAGTAFLKHYDIDYGQARRFPAELQDGILCLDLKQGTVVSSNREGRGRTQERTSGRSFRR
jgi:hypothetical protein